MLPENGMLAEDGMLVEDGILREVSTPELDPCGMGMTRKKSTMNRLVSLATVTVMSIL